MEELNSGASLEYTRQINLRLILRAIKNNGPISRANLARLVKLSPPTVSSLVAKLETAKLVRGTDKDQSDRGRPPQMVEFNEHAGYVIALEINYTFIRATYATLRGTPLKVAREPRNRFAVVSETIDQCVELVKQLSIQSQIPLSDISALSISVPGIVNSETGEVVLAKHLLGWHQVPLGKLIQSALGIPVFVENDIRCAALGEFAYGVAQGHKSFVYIGLCGGIGSAIILNGALIHGSHFLAGEIGYLSTNLGSTGNTSIERKYLENIISIGVIRENILQELRRGRRSSLEEISPADEDQMTLSHILANARENDAFALEVTNDLAKGLAYAVANMSVMFDPDLIVLGPNYGAGEEILLAEVEKLLDQQLPFHPEVTLSQFSSNGMASGALFIAGEKAIEQFLANLNGSGPTGS
ncbi:MAG: ROK family transcriptional regulator [Anaerolineales bacterium]|jgi:predicted NBD/HSP70 family sugar kinase